MLVNSTVNIWVRYHQIEAVTDSKLDIILQSTYLKETAYDIHRKLIILLFYCLFITYVKLFKDNILF